jgi:hypothetical protein
MASSLKSPRNGAVHLIEWLDVETAIMAPIEVWADDQAEENTHAHATDYQMCAVEKPKLRERKMGVVVRFV